MATHEQDLALQDAKKLEEIRFNQWLSESANKRENDISASRQALAARGIGQSPMNFTAEAHIIFTSIEAAIDKAIEFRRELGGRVPALLNPANLQSLEAKLERFVDQSIEGVKQRAVMQGRGGHSI